VTQKKTTGLVQQCHPLKPSLVGHLLRYFFLLTLLVVIPSHSQASPILSSAAEVDYPPFSIIDDDGRADGFSVELLRAAMKAMGREVSFQTGPWPNVRKLLETGEIQALPLVGRTPEREKLFDFTFPYMSLHGAIVVREKEHDINSLDDLRGRQVAVMRGDNAEEFLLREDRGIKYVTTASFEDALQQLSDGRHDAVVLQRLVALRLIQETGLKNLRILDEQIDDFRQDFCFAVKEGDRDTLALLNEGLALVMADGTYRFLHAKWFASLQLPVKRKILVGGDFNYPPYEFLDETGQPTGFATEVTQALAQEMNLDIEIRLGPWSEAVKHLEKGQIDVIQGMFYLPERDLTFDFSQSYMLSHYVTAMRKKAGPIPSQLKELAGLSLVIQKGDAILNILQRQGGFTQVTEVESQEDALKAVAEGKYDCAIVSRVSALHQMKQHDWPNLQLGNQPIYSMEYAYAVAHGQKALLAEFSEGLKVLERNGEYRRIYQKWMAPSSTKTISFIDILILSSKIITPLLLVTVGVILWTWSLRRKVAARTAELKESEARYRSFFENSTDAIMLAAPDGRIFSANSSTCRMFDRSEEEIIRIGREGLVDKTDPRLNELLEQRKNQGKVKGELNFIKKGGTEFQGEITSALYLDHQGNEKAGIVIRDITVSKRIERALRESQKRYHGLFESIRDAILMVDLEQDNIECNQAFVELFGFTRKEVVEQKADQIQEYAKTFRSLGQALQHNLEDTYLLYTSNYQKKGGDIFPGETSISFLIDEKGNIKEVIGLIRDISLRVKAEEGRDQANNQLRQAQRLEAIGRLAGGVAHDFNNMLGVIIGYTQMAMTRIDPQEELADDLQEVLKAAQRSTAITRQLLTFARKQNINPKVLNLNESINDMVKMLRHLIGADIELLWDPGEVEWMVKIDPSQIDQILANLCINSRDSITGVGKVTIRTAQASVTEGFCLTENDFIPGDYVVLTVEDDGCGMDSETLENIFEPFFTTKESGEGTGLGLPTIYGIVKQNKGFITTCSNPGEGTKISIYLPHHAEKSS